MPVLGRRFRVVRPDMRGFGQSTAMPVDYQWSIDRIIEDFLTLADALDLEASISERRRSPVPIAFRLAARHPERVRSLAVLGGIVSGEVSVGARADSWLEHIEQKGGRELGALDDAGRLGSACCPEMMEGWAKLMGRTSLSTQLGFIRSVPAIDVRGDLPLIQCPVLVVTTDGSGLGSVEAVRAWQQTIPTSDLMVVPGDSYHVAATDSEICARSMVDFIRRRA